MKEFRKVVCLTDGVVSVDTDECANDDYNVIARYWVNSDNEFIREWTNDEYIKCSPYSLTVIPRGTNEKEIDVVCHCIELRQIYATNKSGRRLMEFVRYIDYNN